MTLVLNTELVLAHGGSDGMATAKGVRLFQTTQLAKREDSFRSVPRDSNKKMGLDRFGDESRFCFVLNYICSGQREAVMDKFDGVIFEQTGEFIQIEDDNNPIYEYGTVRDEMIRYRIAA